MKILTLDDRTYVLEKIPEWVDEKLRFAVLDNSDPTNPDFFYIPLIFLESFSSPSCVLDIGGYEVQMPIDWHIAVGCPDSGNDIEVLPLTSIGDRGFEAFLFNPHTSFKPDFTHVKVINYYNDVKWYFPKIKSGQMLAVPLSNGPRPVCAYFVKDISRQCEQVDYGDVW